ncbi:MAG: putative metal-binding motif-containing protein [Planctomycetota bacterium]
MKRIALLIFGIVLASGAAKVTAVCVDNDGDGYGSPADAMCTFPQLDCNDNNALINPGRPERCDNVDNNCSGANNEGFDVGNACEVVDPPGCMVGDPAGCCVTGGTLVCRDDGLGTRCLTGAITMRAPEGPGGAANCFDLVDNDCDGAVDHADVTCRTAEVCNGFDDDFDGTIDDGFPGLAANCSVGAGVCERMGIRVCNAGGNGTLCSASPGPAGSESGDAKCSDGLDNDCDGLVDLNDPNCQGAEQCDGIDNNNNGTVDEGFAGLGSPCSVGIGQCLRNGIVVCSADHTQTTCSVSPGLGSAEGPSGATCSDGVDNDCDGLVDLADVNCNLDAITVACALPNLLGRGKTNTNHDCTSWQRVQFEVGGIGPNALVTAEVQAFAQDGTVVRTLDVENGDVLELAALKWPNDCIEIRSRDGRHRIHAPIALLVVTVEDQGVRKQAFCSNTPYLDVVEPSGQVVSSSDGDVTPVLAAIPLVDPASLFVKVDGVDLLDELGIDPSTAFPGGPYSGTVMINGNMVEVTELIVRWSNGETLSQNVLSMNLGGLGGGGHFVVVDGNPAPGALPTPVPSTCFVDDVRDKGQSAGFEIQITSPTPGQVTAVVPTPVIGQVCSGTPIDVLVINDAPVDTSGQLFTPGDGENSADTYKLFFNRAIGQTNLAMDLATGNGPTGTFDRGSNRLVVDCLDENGNRTFATLYFAVGAVDQEAVDVPNAFVVGLSPQALQAHFDARCQEAGQQFIDRVRQKLQEAEQHPIIIEVGVDCCCDPDVKFRPVAPHATGNAALISCDVDFMTDKMHVTINLPPLDVFFGADGTCEDEGIFGECFARTRVHARTVTHIVGAIMEFDITENNLKGIDMPAEPTFFEGTSTTDELSNTSDVGCWGCDLCAGLVVIGNAIVQILTFGLADNALLDLLIPSIDVTNADEVKAALGASQPDPIELKEIKVDEETVSEFMQTLMADLDVVEIRGAPNAGLVASLKATFSTVAIDPSLPPTPGAVLTPGPPPSVPSLVAGAEDAYIAIADDTMNQLFASATASGLLKAQCQSTGKTAGDVLNLAADCESIVGSNPNVTAALQGQCHGFKGEDCATIPVVVGGGLGIIERGTCSRVQQLNLTTATPLLICAQQEVPPRLLITDNAATPPVETALRMNDLSVAMVADRDNNGLDGDLLTLRGCFAQGASAVGDCNLFAVCLDLNIMTEMEFMPCEDNKPGIVTTPISVQASIRKLGVVCGAASATDDDALLDAGGNGPQIDDIMHAIENSTPPLCANGLTLNGFVNFLNPRLIAIDVVGGDPDFGDYLGITGEIQP